MRIDKNSLNLPGDSSSLPKKSLDLDLPKKSGIENKAAEKTVFTPENKKIIHELAKKLGRDVNIQWLLHDEKTADQSAEVLRQLALKLFKQDSHG